MSALRENWRIIMLVFFLVASGIGIFAPGIGASTGATNLEYGLDLDGGTRIRAPLVGIHAVDANVGNQSVSDIQRDVADELEVENVDVGVLRGANGTADIEIYTETVEADELRTGLNNLGYAVSAEDIRDGVTEETRTIVVNTLQEKVNRGGLTGGTVTQLSGSDGQNFVVVEVPNANQSEVVNLVGDRGIVQIVAEVRQGGNTTNETVLTGDDMTVGQISPRAEEQGGGWEIGVTINNDQAAQEFTQSLQRLGFTSAAAHGGEGRPANCARTLGGSTGSQSYCLLTELNDRVIHVNGMGTGLARTIDSGDFVNSPTFTIGAANQSIAQNVRINLQIGALPTNMDLDRGTSTEVAPSLAQEFKLFALITGLVAWIGVAAMVFLRYKEVRVAIPMLFTAIAEVFILLGFSSVVGLALDLSHIAGFIAVIGTGVDDLVIIADEILQQGNVATGRVFQNRFRKAFWVIGAAAATTIIAMSPLAVLSLGDLQGFAIVTIAGVLIGVLITRPAYGDILRNLVLSEDQR